MTRLFQITQRIVDGCETDARQKLFGFVENFIRRRMLFGVANNLQNNLALPRQTQVFYIY
jgi:hypothetical protein